MKTGNSTEIFRKLRIKNRHKVILAIILLVSLVARFHGISDESLWLDETINVYYGQKPLSESISYTLNDVNPPLYDVVLSLWIKAFGINETSVRSLSALFGTLAVLMIYLVGKEMYNVRVGIFSSAILAVSSFNIYYSKEASLYSLFVLLTLTSFYFYVRNIKCNTLKDSIGYISSGILLLYTHIFAVLVLLVQILFLFFRYYKKKLKNASSWVKIQSIVVLLYIPWIPILTNQINRINSGFWISNPEIFGFTQFSLSYTLERFSGSVELLVAFVGLVAFYLTARIVPSSKKKANKIADWGLLLFSWLVIPFLFSLLYSVYFQPVFVMRYLIFTSPALYILVSLAITKTIKIKYQNLILLPIFVYSTFLTINFDVQDIIKEEWGPATEFIKNNVKDGETVLIEFSFPFSYYYKRECFHSSSIDNINECLGRYNVFSLKDATNKNFLNSSSVWTVSRSKFRTGDKDELNQCKGIDVAFLNDFKYSSLIKDFGGIDICRFSNSIY